MDYNTQGARESLTRPEVFGEPLRNDKKFRLTSPESFLYNCIAFAMGMSDRWVDHQDIPWHWWPPVDKGATVEHLKKAFVYFGFEDCGIDDTPDELFDKIAIYQKDNEWTHAARIVEDGVFHSKFGGSYDGLHSRGNVLEALYGNVCLVMRRLKTQSHLTDRLKGVAPGVIHTNITVKIGPFTNHIVTYQGKTYLGDSGKEVAIEQGRVVLR